MRTFIQLSKGLFKRSAQGIELSKAIRVMMLALLVQVCIQAANAQGGNLIEITGKVNDAETKAPLPAVSVSIKGAVSGTITDNSGTFTLRTKTKFPLTLVFSSVGFQ